MNVEELIKYLQTLPGETLVYVGNEKHGLEFVEAELDYNVCFREIDDRYCYLDFG